MSGNPATGEPLSTFSEKIFEKGVIKRASPGHNGEGL